MPDFTLHTFHRLLITLKDQHYTFQTFVEFLRDPAKRVIILRHDVDKRKMNSLKTAQLENGLGIVGTYYFRMAPQSFDEEVIKQIASLGHEIGYHYEDLSRCAALNARCGVRGARYGEEVKVPLPGGDRALKNPAVRDFSASPSASLRRPKEGASLQGKACGGVRGGLNRPQDRKTARLQDKVLPDDKLIEMAIVSFRENLERLRRVVPIETICMHGSPLSKYDNRMLWEKYDYRDFGIIGEPYFNLDFNEVLYLTDTGRRWDGEAVSVRDKAKGGGQRAEGRGQTKRLRDLVTKRQRDKEQPATSNQQLATLPRIQSTFDIIRAAESCNLPVKIMFTVHPQRWDNRPIPWVRELVWQNVKNIGKQIVASRYRNDEGT